MIEIERKFLVGNDRWRDAAGPGIAIRQGYLGDGKPSVRVRTMGDRGFLTIKAAKSRATRHEFEYEIPLSDAALMLDTLCRRPPLAKTRYKVSHGGYVWELDVFDGANAGLMIAEVELRDLAENVPLPLWAGPEVTDDPRFFNAYLAERPFSTWGVDYASLVRRLEAR